MTRLYLRTYEIPKNQYKHILTKGAYAYTAFRTDKGLSDFIKRTGVDFIKHNEVMTADHGKVQWFAAENIEIQEKLFWKMEEVPENAVKYTDLSNGSLEKRN